MLPSLEVWWRGIIFCRASHIPQVRPMHIQTPPPPLSSAPLSLSTLTNDLNHTVLHGHGIKASVGRAAHNLVQQEMHQVLIGDKAPEVKLQVVTVHLDLLEAKTPKSTKADALQESLQADLDNAGQHRDLGRGGGGGGGEQEAGMSVSGQCLDGRRDWVIATGRSCLEHTRSQALDFSS